MSTGLIVVIVVVAIILIAVLAMLPRMRASAKRREAERELTQRRETVADEHRTAAREREQRAEAAEHIGRSHHAGDRLGQHGAPDEDSAR